MRGEQHHVQVLMRKQVHEKEQRDKRLFNSQKHEMTKILKHMQAQMASEQARSIRFAVGWFHILALVQVFKEIQGIFDVVLETFVESE